jgi:hypothetical protein
MQVRPSGTSSDITNTIRSDWKHLADGISPKLEALCSYHYQFIELLVSETIRKELKIREEQNLSVFLLQVQGLTFADQISHFRRQGW